MKLIKYIGSIYLPLAVLSACSDEIAEDLTNKQRLTIGSSIETFIDEDGSITRANVVGTAFEDNDKIRLKIICPFTTDTQLGESTWTGSKDNFWLLKWANNGWITLPASDHYDISGSYSDGGGSNLFGIYEAQATPYVYTASTWTEEKLIRDSDGNLYDYYSSVFHADQTREKNYKASDVLWAQQFTQTGAWNIHLSFNHVMTALLITIDDTNLPENQKISSDAVLTLEGMPAIDQAEIVVGDYYADRDKSSYHYGYKAKAKCDYQNNGRVIGVVSENATVRKFSGGVNDTHVTQTAVENTATYTCFTCFNKTGKQYRLIVPPCVLTDKAVFWLRDDERRFKMTLDRTSFEQGKLYNIKMKVGTASASGNDTNSDGQGSDPGQNP